MINITLSDEQVFSLLEQLPKEKKKELLDHLKFEEWLDSPEALELKEQSEKAVKEGRTMTLEQAREKLRKNGKDI
jgi:hypothetical protein